MFLRSALVRRFFSVILLIITVMFIIVYLYSVPLIRSEVYEIERNAARLALDNVYELANKTFSSLERYRQQALAADKQRLKTVVDLTEHQLQKAFTKAKQPTVDAAQVLATTLDPLADFAYDNDGYIWVADHQGKLLIHPDPRYRGVTLSRSRNVEQSDILQRLVQSAIAEGEGYYQYQWQRPGGGPALDKLSYVKNMPQWGLIIGSGLYLEDIEAKAAQQKQAAIQEIREALSQIKVAKTGYLFIFDSEGQLLAHPNPAIDQTNALELIDPASGRPILEELIEVADTGKELHYRWDKPSDPGNFIYDKISLVRSLDDLGWYICSSVYVDELRQSAEQLSQRLLTIALISISVAIVLALYFSDRIAQPIKRLVRTAESVRRGDLSAESGIQRSDEFGVLAQTFDSMVRRLRGSIESLDSEVKARTDELIRHEERQRLILDALPAQIGYLDTQLNHLFVNRGYAQSFDRAKEEIVGQPLGVVLGPEMMADINAPLHRCLGGEEVVFELDFEFHDQRRVSKCMLLPDVVESGEVKGVLVLALDVTAEKEAERRLTEAQRMSAVGQLAGGLAHDFNNLLSVILGNLDAACEHYGTTEGLAKYLNPAIRASHRGAEITGRLLSFSRRQALTPISVNMQALLEDTSELLKGSLPKDIQLSIEVTAKARVFVDPGQLENALVNLALNAKDAMPDGGALRFEVLDRSLPRPLQYDEEVPPGDYVEIRVIDSGTGFSEDALKLAFEPFFTTKQSGDGSGLGLSMVYGFTKQSQGYIHIDSEPGHGASISILLPVDHSPKQSRSPIPHKAKTLTPTRSHELILLAEDDAGVRTLVQEQLRALGFTVITAVDADEAEQLILTLKSLDGLVSDIDMPGRLSGVELAVLMREKYPASKVVLMTGYGYGELPGVHRHQFQILQKPFDKRVLAGAILNED